MHRSSSSNYRGSNGRPRQDNRENSFGGNSNRQKQMSSLDDIKNLPKPDWSRQQLKQFDKNFLHENLTKRPFAEVSNFLNTNSISVTGDQQVSPILSFTDLEIPRDIMNKIQEMKYERPTPIQSMCWPSLLNGNDLVGIAQTGSGKTFGFILPMLIHIMKNQRYIRSFNRDDTPGPIGLVVAPTRELAMQIQQVANDFGQQLGVRNVVIYGGSPKNAQLHQARRGAELYIATPGRLIDFVKENQMSLNRCTFLVLDEADRMLDMGFEPQIRKIIEHIRPDRQTAMFSATWPREVRKLAEDFISNYVHINIGAGELTANPNIKQIIEVCQEYEKESKLKQVLAQIMNQRDSKAIVFAETKKKVDMYSKVIQSLGLHCLAIHGDKKQQEREWVLNEFKKKPKSILCATDVAARGLNISDIKFVINIDFPMQSEDYIHRIGRTARNSNTGTAFTFITSENSKHVPKLIEILRDSNQPVNDNLLALSRGSGYFRNNQAQRNPRQNYNQNGGNNNYNNGGNNNGGNNNQAFKRNSSAMDESRSFSRNDANDDNGPKRMRRNRWDEGTEQENVKSENGYNSYSNGNANGNSNGYQNNYQNKYQNGASYPKSNGAQPVVPLMQTGLTIGQSPIIPSSLPAPPQMGQIPTPLLAGPAMYQNYANYF